MRRAAAVLLCLAGLLGAAAWVLAATETGLRWVLRGAASVAGDLRVGSARGSLAGGFSLSDLDWRSESLAVHFDGMAVDWNPRALWRKTLHIRSLRGEGLRIVRLKEPEGSTGWPQFELPLAVAVDELRLRDGAWFPGPEARPVRIDRLETAFGIDGNGVRIDRLAVATPEAEGRVAGALPLKADQAVDLTVDWSLVLPERPALRGTGTVQGDLRRLQVRQNLAAPAVAELRGEVLPGPDAVRWTARLSLPEVPLNRFDPRWAPWPVSAHLEAEGVAGEARVAGDLALVLPEVGPAVARFSAAYRPSGEIVVDSADLEVRKTGTRLAVAGQVRELGAQPVFDLRANWKNLAWPPGPEPSWRSPEGTAKVAGSLRDARIDLAGMLREQRIEAGGRIGVEAETLRFRDLAVQGAGAVLKVNGTVGPRLDLDWVLEAKNLGLWVPGAKGRLASKGRVEGPRAAPAVDADFSADGVSFRDFAVRTLKLRARAGMAADSPVAFELSAGEARWGGRRLDATATVTGSRNRHRLVGRVTGTPYFLALELDGGWREDRWQGTVERFDFGEPLTGRWTLQRAAALRLSGSAGEVGEACWGNRGAEGCLQGRLAGGNDWRLSGRVARFPLAWLSAGLSKPVAVSGFLNGRADLQGTGGRVADGTVDLRLAEGRWQYRGQEGPALIFQPQTAFVRAAISPQRTELDLALDDPKTAAVHGSVALAGALDLSRRGAVPLAGNVNLAVADLAVVEPWVPQLTALTGRLDADLELAGTASDPVVRLRASAPEAGFAVPLLGIKLADVRLEAESSEPRQIRLRAGAKSGGGELALDGAWRLDEAAGWPLSLRLRGRRFQAADIREARVFISPELGIRSEGPRVWVDGTVEVPEASISIPEEKGAVKPSEDVVITGKESPAKEGGLQVFSRVRVVLGDKVRVEGSGLRARLDGDLTVEQQPGEAALGTGQILIREGSYAFYGVELSLQEGRLSFARSPIDNPGLDINVTRRSDQVLAGLRVLGPLKKPSFNLYSDPPLAQSDILAYLVTGKSLNLTTSQEGGMMQQAAASLGGPAGSLLVKEIGSRFGLGGLLDDVSVQTSQAPQTSRGTQNASLFLGKYLTPRLYLQYGFGLFQSGNVFRIRYELSKNWKIQSETGEYSGGDIFFEWEK
jgi:translocation and assembly module TamB